MDEGSQHRRSLHRRALSDTTFRGGGFFDGAGDGEDDLLFDPSDMDDLTLTFDLFPTNVSEHLGATRVTPSSVDSSQDVVASNGVNPPPNLPRPRPISHVRSLSVDSEFFDSLTVTPPAAASATSGAGDEQLGGKRRYYHQRSISMDGTASFELEAILAASTSKDGSKKAIGMSSERLAELALVDPKKAKRIIANRQSAARSKERRVKYTNELEKKVVTLQNEATTLSAQVTKLQQNTTELTAENQQLKLRLQAMEQQAQLRDALHEALRHEIQRLRIATAEFSTSTTEGNRSFRGTQHPR